MFVQRDKREEFYKEKDNLIGKKCCILPFLSESKWAKVSSVTTRFISMSRNQPTTGRDCLGELMHSNHSIITNFYGLPINGKILLRETETSRITSFSTHEEFNDYLDEINKR